MKTCNIKRCSDKYYAKGLCQKHYEGDNKERIAKVKKQYWKKYYQDHKEERIKDSRQYYQDNKEYIIKWMKQYSKTPAGKLSNRASVHNRRILEKGLTKAIIQRVYEANIVKHGQLTCILCFKPIEFGKDSLEHLTPLSRGGNNDFSNLGVAHRVCNKQKFTKTLEEWAG